MYFKNQYFNPFAQNLHKICTQNYAKPCKSVQKSVQICTIYDFSYMKISAILDTRRKKNSGKYPVKIRYSYNGQRYFINTGIDVFEEHFSINRIIGDPKARMYNNIICDKLSFVENTIKELYYNGLLETEFADGAILKKYLESGGGEITEDKNAQLLFKNLITDFANKRIAKRTNQIYMQTLIKVAKFCDIENLYISDINIAWLKDFDDFCTKSGMSANGKALHFRNIRAVYNDAIDREFVGLDTYPFRRFKIKHSETKHRNASIDDLRYILNFDCEKFIKQQKEAARKEKKHTSVYSNPEKYRDLFMLSFYLCGLNLKDLLFLKPNDIRNGTLSILREKTKIPIVIRIEPEAQAIIDKYKGQKYLLNFLDTYTTDDSHNFTKRCNDNLKMILPFVTIYWARHSWATIAAELDIPDSTIDIAMGHKIKGMASVYINRNLKKVSAANRKVIDYLFGKIEAPEY